MKTRPGRGCRRRSLGWAGKPRSIMPPPNWEPGKSRTCSAALTIAFTPDAAGLAAREGKVRGGGFLRGWGGETWRALEPAGDAHGLCELEPIARGSRVARSFQ